MYRSQVKHQFQSVAENDGKLITAEEYKAGPLKCIGCNETMYFRRKHKRKMNNTEFHVRCTFVHKNENVCESYQHKTAKKIIATTLPLWNFTFEECTRCNAKKVVQFKHNNAMEEVSFHKFKLDVGIFFNEHVIGAVEIYYTHRVDEEKKLHLDSSILWVELSASEVIDCFQRKDYNIQSLNINKLCAHCKQKDLDKITEKKERRQMMNEDVRTKLKTKEKTNQKREIKMMQYEDDRTKEYNGIILLRKYSRSILTFGKYNGACVSELLRRFRFFKTRDLWYLRYLAGYARSKYYKNDRIPNRIKYFAQLEIKYSIICMLCENYLENVKNLLCTSCWVDHQNSCLRCDRYIKSNYTFCYQCHLEIKVNKDMF